MDRGGWQVIVCESQRDGHDLATKEQQIKLSTQFKKLEKTTE